jgi:hypothetical protein
MRDTFVTSFSTGLTRWRAALLFIAVLTGCAACGAGSDDPVSPPEVRAADETREVQQDVTLALVAKETTAQSFTAILSYARKPHLEGPRAMEIILNYEGALSFGSSRALGAALAADKDVVVQEREAGVLRVILYASDNLNRLDSGDLVELSFARSSQGSGAVDFVTEETKLAPSESMRGILFSDRLVVGGQ